MRIGICDTTFARFDMGAAAIDELKNNATDLTIIRQTVPGVKDLPVTAKILEVFVHEDEEDNPEDLKVLAENRAREHAQNLIKMMYHPKAMRKEAGTGVREGKPNVGPL